jgi:hypothetical protein
MNYKCIECENEYSDDLLLWDEKLQCWLCKYCFTAELTGKAASNRASGLILRNIPFAVEAATMAGNIMFDRLMAEQKKRKIRPLPTDSPPIDKV